jgi:hypothetical protein
MLAFTPEYRPPLVTVPQFIVMVALIAGIALLIREVRLRRKRSGRGASPGSSRRAV